MSVGPLALSDLARSDFARDGVLRVAGAVSSAEVAAMRGALWDALAAYGVRDDRATWQAGGALPLVELTGALRPGTDDVLWPIGRGPAFANLGDRLARVAADVFGPGAWEPLPGALPAPNFPRATAWSMPHGAWHVDEPTYAGQVRSWGLLGFVVLEDIGPGGGATVAIAGSHRRLLELAGDAEAGVVTTVEALASLGREPWFAALLAAQPVARAHRSGAVDLQLVELIGAAGDVVFLDPRCLHTISANASARPRLTLRTTYARCA